MNDLQKSLSHKNAVFAPVPLFLWGKAYDLSNSSKLLYGLILSRVKLSQSNNWKTDGNVYIIYTIKEVCEKLKCREQKATTLMRELENHRLIRRESQGVGRPYKIYPLVMI